jgi:hypothetical protein
MAGRASFFFGVGRGEQRTRGAGKVSGSCLRMIELAFLHPEQQLD